MNKNYILNILDVNFIKIIDLIKELNKMSPESYNALHTNGSSKGASVWKNHQEELIDLSSKHFDLTFQLFIYDWDNNTVTLKIFKNKNIIIYNGVEAHKMFYTPYKD